MTTSTIQRTSLLVVRIARVSGPVKNDSLSKIRIAIFYLTPGRFSIEFRMRVGATLVIKSHKAVCVPPSKGGLGDQGN